MMRRRRHAKYPSTSAAAGSDTDALQTDVMRFMSIIGLCLMAVFALVQGIPLQEQGKPAQPSQPARLREEISLQQQQVRELQAALQSLRLSMQQRLTTAKEHLRQAAGQAQQARAERDQLESRLEILGRQLEQQRQALADIEQDSRQKEQNLDELRQRLLNTQRQLDQSRTEIETLQHQSRQPAATPVIERQAPPAPVPEAVTTPAPKPEPATDRQGFTLRFESDAALDRLVAAGSVTLYAMAGQQAWRLSMTPGGPAAAEASFPRWYHEMSAATVPAHYSRRLENAAPGRSSVVWGVQLPAAAKQAIALLTRQRQGGELLIRGDGQVVLED